MVRFPRPVPAAGTSREACRSPQGLRRASFLPGWQPVESGKCIALENTKGNLGNEYGRRFGLQRHFLSLEPAFYRASDYDIPAGMQLSVKMAMVLLRILKIWKTISEPHSWREYVLAPLRASTPDDGFENIAILRVERDRHLVQAASGIKIAAPYANGGRS